MQDYIIIRPQPVYYNRFLPFISYTWRSELTCNLIIPAFHSAGRHLKVIKIEFNLLFVGE